ncbi:hypothetical protein LJC33_00885 [Eubacteriales bacterium OttesenSCG-928-N13]|nr:hypothetical protein [Eubacteriales bacterium OttesenSCG-928-N13]
MMRSTGYVGYLLREMMKQQDIASVLTNPHNPDDFIAGYVRAINGRSALLLSIGPYGHSDGWFAVRLASVLEVAGDTPYAQRLTRLIAIHGDPLPNFPDDQSDWQEGDHIGLILRYAQRHGMASTIWTSDDAYTGFVDEIDDLFVTMQTLDMVGRPMGPVKLKLVDAELISVDSEEEHVFQLLYNTPEK